MKIIKQTSQKLVLKKRTGLNPFLLIWGSFFAGIPSIMLLIMFYNLGIININCQRIEPKQVDCELNRTGFGGLIKKESQVLNNITQAKFEQTQGQDSEGNTTVDNQVIIQNKQGQNFIIQDSIYINGVRGDAQKMRQIESQINNFLNISELSLVLKIDNRWRWSNLFIFGFISVFIFIGGGVVVGNILITGYEQIVFDKLTNQFAYKKVNLLGKKDENHSLREIRKILIEESIDSDGDKHYSLILPIGNQKYILDSGYHNFNGDRLQQTAEKISNFLQITIKNIVK
jgi:hypothetical protein